MTTYALLLASLVGTTGAPWSAGAPPDPEPRKELVIPFAWQPAGKWQVEIREYQFRHGMPPKLQTIPWNIEWREYREAPVLRAELIEAQYSPDLCPLFRKAKSQDR